MILLAAPATASAQNPPPQDLVVNTTADPGDGACNATECTLREAVSAARPVDSVFVPSGRYSLTAGPIDLAGDTIFGAGARTTIIDGSNLSRVFSVGQGSNHVSRVTITGGNGVEIQGPTVGGGILVEASFAPVSLTLTESAVTGNTSQAGGGIIVLSGGTLTLVRSTASGNLSTGISGSHGGGIYLQTGTVTLRDSTVSGNTARDTPSAFGNADGGGIYVDGGTLVTQNVTLAGNQASGDGGVFREPAGNSSVTLASTIVASGPDRNACAGGVSFFAGDHNLSDDFSCGFGEPTDRQNVDPQLGGLTDNGGPTNTHALAATSPAVDAGAGCSATDQRGVARAGACDVGAFEYVVPSQPSPPPPLPPLPPPPHYDLPPPVAGKSVNVSLKSGTVRVRLRGKSRFVRLEEARQIPVGSTVDTLKGRVTLVAAADRAGGTAAADFYAGVFRLGQTKGAKPLTTLTLVEKLSCAGRGKASAAAKKKKRRLWGDGKGRFRTRGSYSSATVRGTKWLTEDRCTSTLTRVAKGRVTVRDLVKRKNVVVKAGKQYVAKRRR